jgi:hypothetical protein
MMIGFDVGDYRILFSNDASIYKETIQEDYTIATILLSAL